MRVILLLIGLFMLQGDAVAATPQGESVLDSGLMNPGYHEQPDWFKASFLDIREDVATGAYLRQPNFQRFLQARRTSLEAWGFEVDLMD